VKPKDLCKKLRMPVIGPQRLRLPQIDGELVVAGVNRHLRVGFDIAHAVSGSLWVIVCFFKRGVLTRPLVCFPLRCSPSTFSAAIF
jgi:hypothetical protein